MCIRDRSQIFQVIRAIQTGERVYAAVAPAFVGQFGPKEMCIRDRGKPFDPNFHNAVMHVDDESLGENVVASELLKGYMYRDTVVRHSMVQVAN